MPLTKQFVDIPTVAGVDTKTDSVNDIPPALADTLNIHSTNIGSYTPRTGFSVLGSQTDGSPGYVVGLRGAVYSENSERLYKTAGGESKPLRPSWSPECKRLPLGLQYSGGSTGASQVTSCILSDGKVFCVWRNVVPNAGVSWQILSAAGEYEFGGTILASNALDFIQVDCAAGLNGAGLICVILSTGVFAAYTVSPTTAYTTMTVPSITSMTQLKVYTHGGLVYMVYKTSTPATIVRTFTMPDITQLVAANTLTLTTNATTGRHIDLSPTSSHMAVGYWNTTTTVKVAFLSSVLGIVADVAVATDTTAYTQMNGFGLIEAGSSNVVMLVYSGASNTLGAYVSAYRVTTSGSTSRHAQVSVSFLTVSSPVLVGTKIVVGTIDLAVQGYASNGLVQIAGSSSSPYGADGVIDLVANWSSGTASTGRVSALMSRSSAIPFNTLGRIAQSASGIYVPSLYINRITEASESLLFTGIGLVPPEEMAISTVTGELMACVFFASTTASAATVGVSQGASSAIMGPRTTSVDGSSVGPSSVWPMFAPQDMLLQNATGLTASSTYFVVFVKRWIDSYGNSQTMETPAVRIVTDAGTYLRPQFSLSKGAFKLPDQASGTWTEAVIDVYLTEANGTIPYYNQTITSASSFFTGAAPYYFVINNASIDLSSPLPSSSGEISNTSLSAVRHAVAWKGRIAALVADNPKSIAYSKPNQNNEFISFAPGLDIVVPQADTDLTALASMDGVLYAFTENQVYTIYGDPAGSTGEGSTLTLPEIRFNGVGCRDPRSVILTPKGIFFNSDKGVYLILRNQELVFIGVGPFDDRTSTITGSWATLKYSEVGYTLSDGTAWVYDWQINAWFRWEVPRTSGSDVISDATYLNDTVVYNTTSGLYIEDSSSVEVVPISLTTAWIRLGALQGYQRVYNMWLYLERLADHTLTVDMYIDGSETSVYTWSIASTGLATTVPEQIRLSVPVQKCSAIKLKIASANAGWKLKGIMAEIGVKDSAFKSRNTPNNY